MNAAFVFLFEHAVFISLLVQALVPNCINPRKNASFFAGVLLL